MVKADGCVAIHADGGAYKPLNWMNAPNTLVEEPGRVDGHQPEGRAADDRRWTRCCATSAHDLGTDPGLSKDGVEAHLQELLAARPARHRGRADAGAPGVPDRHRPGRPAVPGRRRAAPWPSRSSGGARSTASSSSPATSSASTSTARCGPVRGIFVAQVVKPQARVLAEARGLRWVEVDYDELRGPASPTSSRCSDVTRTGRSARDRDDALVDDDRAVLRRRSGRRPRRRRRPTCGTVSASPGHHRRREPALHVLEAGRVASRTARAAARGR